MLAARLVAIQSDITSILFEHSGQSDGVKCKLDQELSELTANLVSWFVIKESAFSSNTILHGRPHQAFHDQGWAGNMYTEGNSNWVNALMTNNSFQYKLAD